MTDPLSVTAGTAGFVSLAITVCQGLIDYYQKYKDQGKDVAKTTQAVKSALETLISLESILDTRKFSPNQKRLVASIERSVDACEDSIYDLQEELERIRNPSTSGFRATVRAEARKLSYPFRAGTLAKLQVNVQEIGGHILLAIQALNLGQSCDIQVRISDLKATLVSMRKVQIHEQVLSWLKAPDPYPDLHDASDKRQSGTGQWLVKGAHFETWLRGEGTFLWLNGLAGCGKSVLSSTVVEQTLTYTRVHHGMVAFYFFRFSDTSKQDLKGLLQSLLLQFSYQSPTGSKVLESLYSRYKPGEPSISALKETLKEVLSTSVKFYLVIDALDEAPRGKRRKEVLEFLSQIRSWRFAGSHLLVTSRDELDINQSLSCGARMVISLENSEVSEDIRAFISERLRTDVELLKWREYTHEIESALIEGASGMFRWVECQFSSLSECDTLFSLRTTLKSLPSDLNETYDRALGQVAHIHRQDAKRLLMWLCYARRPLKSSEMIHILAIDLDGSHRVDSEKCRLDHKDLLKICPSLVKFGERENEQHTRSKLRAQTDPLLALAHFSVREYLLSGQMQSRYAEIFGIDALVAEDLLAKTSLFYLLQFDETNIPTEQSIHEYPLADYAARWWFEHLKTSREQRETRKLAHALLASKTGTCLTWACLHDVRTWSQYPNYLRTRHRDWSLRPDHLATPLFYVVKLGLDEMCREHLRNSCSKAEINTPWLSFSFQPNMSYTPLQAAIEKGNIEIMESLIDSGADPHFFVPETALDKREHYESWPLAIAVHHRRGAAIDLLFSKGVDPERIVSRGDFESDSPLKIACEKLAVEAVEALIRGGVNATTISTHRPAYYRRSRWTPLHCVFSSLAHEHSSELKKCQEIVSLLVKAGANPTIKDSHGETPFFCAIKLGAGYRSVSEMGELCYPGAISECNDLGRGPLHALTSLCKSMFCDGTCLSRRLSLLRSLLAARASLAMQDSMGRTPLAMAAQNLSLTIMNVMLDEGADPKILDGDGAAPLHHFCASSFSDRYMPRKNPTTEELQEAAKRLCSEEVDFGYGDARGKSAGHVGAQSGQITMIVALLNAGASLLILDHEGSTALGLLERRMMSNSLDLIRRVEPGLSTLYELPRRFQAQGWTNRPVPNIRSNRRECGPTLRLDDLPDAFDRFFFRLRRPPSIFYCADDIGFLDKSAYRQLFGHLLIRETAHNGRWDIVNRMLEAAESHFRLDSLTMIESVIDSARTHEYAVDAYPLEMKEDHTLRGKADYVNLFIAVDALDSRAVRIFTQSGVDLKQNSQIKRASMKRLKDKIEARQELACSIWDLLVEYGAFRRDEQFA